MTNFSFSAATFPTAFVESAGGFGFAVWLVAEAVQYVVSGAQWILQGI